MNKIKIIVLFFAILFVRISFSQNKIPIIKATSINVDIKENNKLRKNAWRIVPEEKLDIYTTSAKVVTFILILILFLLELNLITNTILSFY
ncbi:MAG: hypothetical protein LC134_04770 [Chitinophagales bacterium]|nr:hypothetical protein [Chitinophagales bacterium]